MKPKRILQIFEAPLGAPETEQGLLVARGLRERAFEDEFDVQACFVSDRRSPRKLREAGLDEAFTIERHWPLDPVAWRKLRHHIERLRPDLVHAWVAGSPVLACLALSGVRGIPLVISQRRLDVHRPWFWSKLAQRQARQARAIVAPSNAARRRFAERGWPVDRLRVIHDGAAQISRTSSREAIFARVGVPHGVRLIAVWSRFETQARLKDAIWTTDMFKVFRDDVHLLVFGAGPERGGLERFCDCCALNDKVHFLGEPADTREIIAGCDVFWAPNGRDDRPEGMVAALASGTPVVASDLPGHREFVTPGENGYLTPMGDRAALGQMAHKILEDPPLAERLRAAARARAMRDFSSERLVGDYAALYRELC